MVAVPTKLSISPTRRQLMELMQSLHFGRIEHLTIRAGEPVFNSSTTVVREIKFGSEQSSPKDFTNRDFPLKAQVVGLFAEFDRLADGVVMLIEIKHGLPFRMLLAESGR